MINSESKRNNNNHSDSNHLSILDEIAKISTIKTSEKLNIYIASFFQRIKIKHYNLLFLGKYTRKEDIKYMSSNVIEIDNIYHSIARNYPDQFLEIYEENSYANFDPSIFPLKIYQKPTSFTKAISFIFIKHNKLNEKLNVRKMFEDFALFQLHKSVIIPIFTLSGFAYSLNIQTISPKTQEKRLHKAIAIIFQTLCEKHEELETIEQLEQITNENKVIQFPETAPTPTPSYRHTLTPKELEVLKLIVYGKSNEDIAYISGVTLKTIEFHTSKIYKRLKVATRVQAAVKALVKGIIIFETYKP